MFPNEVIFGTTPHFKELLVALVSLLRQYSDQLQALKTVLVVIGSLLRLHSDLLQALKKGLQQLCFSALAAPFFERQQSHKVLWSTDGQIHTAEWTLRPHDDQTHETVTQSSVVT